MSSISSQPVALEQVIFFCVTERLLVQRFATTAVGRLHNYVNYFKIYGRARRVVIYDGFRP